MKICWDNLEKIRYSKKTGNFRIGNTTYYYHDSCENCKNPFLGTKRKKNKCCSIQCSNSSSHIRIKRWRQMSGKNNHRYGRQHSNETRMKISADAKKRYINPQNNPNWQGGISCEPYCFQWSDKEYKNWLKCERDNGKCQNPQCTGKSNKIVLHHINYNKKDCRPLNLITLCNACNASANYDREWHEAWYTIIMKRRE